MLCSVELKNNPNLNIYQNIQKSDIHAIVHWTAILPYSEVTRWVYENVNTKEHIITNRKGTSISPMNPNSFHKIYKLPKPLVFLNNGMEKFTVENPKPLELIQEWWDKETPFTISKLNRVYNTQYFKPPYQLLDFHDMHIVWGRELHTLQKRVDNDGAYSGRNKSDIQLGINPIIQHLPQYPGGA
jgi:hypothetical protein